MKNKYYQNLNYLTTTPIFKIFVLLMILINLYVSSCTTFNLSYFESLIKILTFPFYIIVFFFLLLSLSAKSYQIFKQNYFEMIRYENKINCIKHLVKQLFFNISVCILLNLLFLLIGLNIFHTQDIGIHKIIGNTSIIVYCIFYLIRFYIFCILFSLINLLMLSIFNQKIVLLLSIILLFTIPDYFIWLPSINVDNFNEIPILFTGFFSGISCSNIMLEICATVGHILLMIIVYYLFYYHICKQDKIIFE